jgi:hypothetical protein
MVEFDLRPGDMAQRLQGNLLGLGVKFGRIEMRERNFCGGARKAV